MTAAPRAAGIRQAGGVRIDPRFNGPPGSANGGVTCGLLAGAVDLAQPEVTLRVPPPLGVDLRLHDNGLYHGEQLVAQAAERAVELEPPRPVSVAVAREARRHFAGTDGRHPFPGCFVCGPDHPTGLHLHPGTVGPSTVAVDWTPADDDPVMVWAALDCTGGWSADLPGRPMVLGRMACRIHAVPTPGEPHVVQGVQLGVDGRKVLTGSALYTEQGQVIAVARATWITVAS